MTRYGYGYGFGRGGPRVGTAPPYVEPEDPPETLPTGGPTEPEGPPTDPDTEEPEPGIDPNFTEATRIELSNDKQTAVRTSTDPGTWGNAYVAAELDAMDYWEIHINSNTPKNATLALGVTNLTLPLNGIPGALPGTLAYWSNGVILSDNIEQSTANATYGRNDKIMIARQNSTGRIWFGKNGTWLGSTPSAGGSGHQGTLTGDGPYYPFLALYSVDTTVTFKFIASKFQYPAPTGFYPIYKTPPANTVLPAISGTEEVGQTLTATTGTWTGSATIAYTYQWERDGTPIGGATASTYQLVQADLDAEITVVVTATNRGGAVSAESAATDPIEQFLAALVKPANTITGVNYTASGSTIPLDEEVYDHGGWHDNATNNTRLTVPSGLGINYVVLKGRVDTANSTVSTPNQLTILKNGSASFDGRTGTVISTNNVNFVIVSGPIPVVAGDYFELHLIYPSDATIDITAATTFFSIEAV